jgi:hypothetical protein
MYLDSLGRVVSPLVVVYRGTNRADYASRRLLNRGTWRFCYNSVRNREYTR